MEYYPLSMGLKEQLLATKGLTTGCLKKMLPLCSI